MTFLFSFLFRQLMKLDKARHPWIRRLALIAAVVGWLSRRFGTKTQSVRLRKGETLLMSVVSDKDRTV